MRRSGGRRPEIGTSLLVRRSITATKKEICAKSNERDHVDVPLMDAIQRSLSQFLPTVPSPYPPSLITTASTIHALSRKKIPLRPDEEASRPFLASFIAAERFPPLIPTNEDTNGRLATVLNLPPPNLSKSTPITIPE